MLMLHMVSDLTLADLPQAQILHRSVQLKAATVAEVLIKLGYGTES